MSAVGVAKVLLLLWILTGSEMCMQSVSQSVSQSVIQSVSQSVSQSVGFTLSI